MGFACGDDDVLLGWDLLLPIGCVNMRQEHCVLQPAAGRRTQFFTSYSRNQWEVINPSPVFRGPEDQKKTCIGHSCSYSTPHQQSLVSKQSMYQVSLETNICVCTATNDHYRSDGHVIREHSEYRLTDKMSHGKRNRAAQ